MEMVALPPWSVVVVQDWCCCLFVSAVSPAGTKYTHSVGLACVSSFGVACMYQETRWRLFGLFLTCGWCVTVLADTDYQVNRRHFQGHFHRAESINSWSASWQQYRFNFLSHGQLLFNFSSSFCILRFTWSALSGSHLKLWPVELGASLWRLVSADDRESISQAVQRPVLCEPSLAPCSSPLFISLVSLAGYMLLIKHATQLLIVNQIQFVPGACCEWASPLRTKVFRTATSELDKRPRASQLSPTPCRDLLKGAIQEGSQKV